MLRRLRDYIDIYYVSAKVGVIGNFQYPMGTYMWILGMIAEPVIYLVVWTNVATSQGGVVGTYTAAGFAAYYIVWTMVRYFNIALTPFAFEWRIKEGQLNGELLRPVHPFHFDLGGFLGWKIPLTLFWLPIAGLLIWVFKPDLHPEPWQIIAFAIAILTGFVMRFTLLWVLGMITFWTTRVSAIFDAYFTLELLLSGRLLPLDLMPAWAQNMANWLPFQWAFGFPIELLLGRLSVQETLQGFLAQAVWFAIGALVMKLMWRAGIKKYSAVGA